MPDAAASLATIEIGATVCGRALTLSLARVLAFSGGPLDEPGWPQRSLHTDLELARAAGLDHLIQNNLQQGFAIGVPGVGIILGGPVRRCPLQFSGINRDCLCGK